MKEYKVLGGSLASPQERYNIWRYHENGRDFIGYAETMEEAMRRIEVERELDRPEEATMGTLKEFYVSACNRRGFVTFTKHYWARSAMAAGLEAREALDRTNTEWHTIWTGDAARPEWIMTTKEG